MMLLEKILLPVFQKNLHLVVAIHAKESRDTAS